MVFFLLYLQSVPASPAISCVNVVFFTADSGEGVTHEGVEDAHGSLGDSGVGVDLLQNAIDVDVVGSAGVGWLILGSCGGSSLLWGVSESCVGLNTTLRTSLFVARHLGCSFLS